MKNKCEILLLLSVSFNITK